NPLDEGDRSTGVRIRLLLKGQRPQKAGLGVKSANQQYCGTISGALKDRRVKPLQRIDDLQYVVAFHRFLAARDERAERLNLLVARPRHEQPGGHGVERAAQLVDLLRVFLRQRYDDWTSMRQVLNEALRVEIAQSFPHQAPAHAGELAQAFFREPLAGLVVQ